MPAAITQSRPERRKSAEDLRYWLSSQWCCVEQIAIVDIASRRGCAALPRIRTALTSESPAERPFVSCQEEPTDFDTTTGARLGQRAATGKAVMTFSATQITRILHSSKCDVYVVFCIESPIKAISTSTSQHRGKWARMPRVRGASMRCATEWWHSAGLLNASASSIRTTDWVVSVRLRKIGIVPGQRFRVDAQFGRLAAAEAVRLYEHADP
jgi:hypothetical protein